nr:ribonuclease E activity regulator RraA [Bacillus yapensis]
MKTSDLCDQFHRELYICEKVFKSYGKIKTFSGPITTVKIYDNHNEVFMKAIEIAEPGSVIILDGIQSKPCAWMGDRKAGIAANRGIAGIIINGYVRDIEGLANLDIGVLALGSHPLSSRFATKKEKDGIRDTTLDFGGIDWTPGHYVYVDSDGIVVSAINFSEQG